MDTITPHFSSQTIPDRIVDTPPERLLKKFSGEFVDPDLEAHFLKATWNDYKKGSQYALFAGGLVILAFTLADLLGTADRGELLLLLGIRMAVSFFLLGSALYIQRTPDYFKAFHTLCFCNQVAVALALILLGTVKSLPFIHNAFHLFMITLIYYQFLHNRFSYTLTASVFFSLTYCAVNLGLYRLEPVDMVRFFLYLGLANGLGIPMLRSLNLSHRKAHIQQLKATHANQQLGATIQQLLQAQKEVKTLERLLPICAKCKQIRDDRGYWNQLETYLYQHSRLKFSHSLCPTCAKALYPEYQSALNKS